MSISISYNGNFNSGVYMIKSGSYIEETNTALSGLQDGEIMMDLSKLHFYMTGAYYEKQSTSGGLQYIMVYFFNDDGQIIAGTSLNFSKVTKSTAYMSEYLCDQTLDLSTVHRYGAYEDDPIPTKIGFQFEYSYKSGSTTMLDDIQIEAANVTGYPYVAPAMSAFAMSRATSGGAVSQQGDYGRYDITSNLAAILASGEPSFIKNDTELTVSFTRSGTDYSHAADPSGTGLLQGGGTALELDPEETFTVTATLTDGINTVSMSALLSANFAIFNCNSTKDSIGIGKYCDGTFTGLDVNMATKFRKATTFDVPPIGLECIWKNNSPTSNMSAGNITIKRALTSGEIVICRYAFNTGSDGPYYSTFGFAGLNMILHTANMTANSGGGGVRTITLTAGSTTISVAAATYRGSTANSYAIPWRLYAVKGGWFNADTADSEYSNA